MLRRELIFLSIAAAQVLLAGCGGGRMPSPTPIGIIVQATPANQTAYSEMPPPQNQVSFVAYISYSDASFSSTPLTGLQWSNNDSWVSLQGNVATCTQPAPVLILGTVFSTVTATAKVNGTTFTDGSGLYCF
jgi:hypothetical protein